jgi:hypothetical protein
MSYAIDPAIDLLSGLNTRPFLSRRALPVYLVRLANFGLISNLNAHGVVVHDVSLA